METRGIFKRIAALTMAALTIATSQGANYNLLSAQAAEVTRSEAASDIVLEKKDTAVAAPKLSFSTNEDLKRAVEDAGFTIDVSTNKVTAASIKYNQSLLIQGKDYTATAKRTKVTKVGSKYNYTFTVTVKGTGNYSGIAKKTGVTTVSTIAPKAQVYAAPLKTTGPIDWSKEQLASEQIGIKLEDGTINQTNQKYVQFASTSEMSDTGIEYPFTLTFMNASKNSDSNGYTQVVYTNQSDFKESNIILTVGKKTVNPDTATVSGGYGHLVYNKYGIKVKCRIATDISDYKITINGDDKDEIEYFGAKPAIAVKKDGSTSPLTDKQDYTKEISNDSSYLAGTSHTITITGVDAYAGSITKTFSITPKTVNKAQFDSKVFEITGLDSASYTGSALNPLPVITYTTKGTKLTLSKDDDYDIEYSGDTVNKVNAANKEVADTTPSSAAPYAKITFKGNYEGTIYKEFSIVNGSITNDGTQVLINGNLAATLTSTSGQDQTTVDVSGKPNFYLDYSPVEEELPHIELSNPAGQPLILGKAAAGASATGDYSVGKPTGVPSGSGTTPVWPNVGTYEVKLTGQGNYSGDLTIKIKVQPLDLGSNKISVVDPGFDNDGKSTAKLNYKHEVGDVTYEKNGIPATEGNSINFTISPADNKKATASDSVKLTLTGKVNYKGTTTGLAGYGKNLADAVESKDDVTSDIRIRAFDPFTGQEITGSSISIPYYGKSISPHYSVEIKDGNTWKAIPSNQFDMSTPTEIDNSDSTTYLYTAQVTLQANGKNSKVYGKKTISYNVVKHSLSKSDADGKWNKELSDDIAADSSQITSSTDISAIAAGLKLSLKPKNAGKFIAIVKGSDGSTTPSVIDDSNSTKADKLRNDADTMAYWVAPSISTTDGTLTLDNDYKVAFPVNTDGRPLNNGTVEVTGAGHYQQTAIITLGQADIGNTDFYIEQNGVQYEETPAQLPDIDYDASTHIPSIALYKKSLAGQQSPTRLVEGTDYTVAYVNPNGEKIDKNGYLMDQDGKYLADGSKVTGDSVDSNGYLQKNVRSADGSKIEIKYVKSDGTTTDTQEQDALKAQESKNGFTQAGKYTIILVAVSSVDTTVNQSSTGHYFGTRKATYSIVANTSAMKATFSKQTVLYSVDSSGNSYTVKPDFKYENNAPSNALKLYVRTAEGVDLQRSTDNGKSGDYTVSTSDDLGEPGTKTFTITGINKYKGQTTTAKYQVTVSMSQLGKDDGLLKSDVQINGTTQDLFYDGGSELTTKAGALFDPDTITLTTKSGYTLISGEDYSIDIDNGYGDQTSRLYTDGPHTVTFQGKGGFLGAYAMTVNVIVTRAGLLWTGDSTTIGQDTKTLVLPWRSQGYQLGQDAMALYKLVNGVRTPVELTGEDEITVGNEKKNPNEWSWNKVGTYTIEIAGPKGSTGSTSLTFSIEYNLSTVTIDLGIDSTVPYSDKDVYASSRGAAADLTRIKVYPAGETNKTLDYVTDYDILRKYTDESGNDGYSKAGTIEVSLSAKTGRSRFFSDTKPTARYTITKLSTNDNYILEADQSNPLETYTYNGKLQTPEGKDFDGRVKYNDNGQMRILTYGTDYTVSYQSDSTNAGPKYVIITGIGNYAGSKTFPNAYQIKPYDLGINRSKVTIPIQYYTGKAITPQKVQVSDVTGDLVFGRDYKVDNASDNTEIGTAAKVDITGAGVNFTGTITGLNFTIKKLDLTSDDALKPEVTDATYNKGGSVGVDDHIKIFIPDGDGRHQLKRDEDYTLQFTKGSNSYATDPTDAGTYTVTISALNDSKYVQGSTTATFKILPLNIEDIASQFDVANAEWTGKAVEPKVTQNGKDPNPSYSVTYENNVEACGKSRNEMVVYDPNFDENKLPTAVITGTGNYTGILRKHFQIGQPFANATITATDNSRLTYNGASQKKEFTVTYKDGSGKIVTLEAARYNVKYPENTTDAGDKVVTFTALGGGPLYGTKTATYTIYPVAGSTWTIEFANLPVDANGMATVQYQGAAIKPEVKAYVLQAGGTRELIPLTPSEITYTNNDKAGTATVSVNPNNYEGTKTLNFKILGVDISGKDVYAAFSDGITRRRYTGSAITPAVTVTFAGSLGTVTLTKDRDFSLTYENNTTAGAANVKITGIGNYSGTKTLSYSIYANLNDPTSTFTVPKQMYTGEAITELSGSTIKAGGKDLKLGTDYTLSINSTDSFRTKGTAIFTAEGPYYEGTRTVQFEIGNDASMYNVLGVAATYVYDRQAHKPVPVITDKSGTVYTAETVTYASSSDGDNCINAGNVRMQITIRSHGSTVTIPYNYTIAPKNINNATISPIADVNYTGSARTPSIRLTDGTNLLTGSPSSSDGTADYTYTYYNNTMPGTATVSITGMNNYTGTANVYFAINVKAAPQMTVTAMPSGRLKVSWNSVSGVSGYRIFYSAANGTQKQITVGNSTKTRYITGLTRGVVYTVGLQSYINANGVNGYSTASVQQIATSTSKPVITSAKSTGKGKIKVTWKKVSNATAYMVYRKAAGQSTWTRVKTTKSTSFTNTGLTSGRSYTYKVISYKQSGVKRSFSQYSAGKTVRAK